MAVADKGLDGFLDVPPRYVVIFAESRGKELEITVSDVLVDGGGCVEYLGLWRAEADKLVDVEPGDGGDDELASQLRLYSGTFLRVVPTRPKLGLGAVGKASCTKKFKFAQVSMSHTSNRDVPRKYKITKSFLNGDQGVRTNSQVYHHVLIFPKTEQPTSLQYVSAFPVLATARFS